MNRFLILVIIGGIITSLLATIILIKSVSESSTAPKYSVEVVGTYKECEILQYTNQDLARYSHLLYCEKP